MRGLIKLGFSLALASVALHPVAQAQSTWKPIISTVDRTFYIDKASLRRQGNTMWYWVYKKYDTPDSDNVSVTMTYLFANCKTKEYRLRTIIDYNARGEVVSSINDGDRGELFQAVPDSTGNSALQYACRTK